MWKAALKLGRLAEEDGALGLIGESIDAFVVNERRICIAKHDWRSIECLTSEAIARVIERVVLVSAIN